MDCKTARLLLDFARPQANELPTEEAGALHDHLDRCADCHTLARDERRFDEQIGEVMRRIDIPSGLSDRLLARLEVKRSDWQRRRFAQAARLSVAAAAAVFLLSWAAWWLLNRPPAPIDPSRVAESVNTAAVHGDKRAAAEETLKALKMETALSPDLNYNLLVGPPSLTDLPGYPGRRVALLFFQRNHRRAWVYLIADNQLPADAPALIAEGTYKLELLPAHEGERFRFLVVHDGDNLDWLRPLEHPAT